MGFFRVEHEFAARAHQLENGFDDHRTVSSRHVDAKLLVEPMARVAGLSQEDIALSEKLAQVRVLGLTTPPTPNGSSPYPKC